jgi:hypothetical protein
MRFRRHDLRLWTMAQCGEDIETGSDLGQPRLHLVLRAGQASRQIAAAVFLPRARSDLRFGDVADPLNT